MIVCRSPVELDRMRAANGLVAAVLAEPRPLVAPGVTTAASARGNTVTPSSEIPRGSRVLGPHTATSAPSAIRP